jgi:hypothetical protein
MAGQTDRSSTGQTGPIARRPAIGRAQPGSVGPRREPIGIEVGPTAKPVGPQSAVSPASPGTAEALPRLISTRDAYRQLTESGITGQEAAGLISYVVGLAPCDSRWSLRQVNRLLFLRNLYHETGWGNSERGPE